MKKKVAREVERQGKKIERKAEKKAEKKAKKAEKKVLQAAKKINRNAKTAAKRKPTKEATREASSSPSLTTVDGLRTPEKRKRLVSENVISADASSSFNSNTVRRLASSLLILTTLHTITLHRSL
jgi:phosphoserine aminotransferase